MKRTYLSTIFISSALSLLVPSAAFAQTIPPVSSPTTAAPKVNQRLTTLQTRGDQLVTYRLTSLNAITSRINGMKHLSATEKTTLTTNISNASSGLTNLKTKIDTDTDLPTLQADVKSIYTTYRIYAEFDPQTSLLAVSDALTTTADQLTDLSTKLQTRINDASANGANVTALNASLTDMQNNISNAKNQYATVKDNISSLTPASYNSDPIGVHSTFVSSRSTLRLARNDLQVALQDAKKIVAMLKTIASPTPGAATTSATPSS